MDAPYGLGFLRGARLAALVQRLRAGEDAAQPDGPVDVRRLAGDLPARRQQHARFLLVLGTNPRSRNRGHNATDTLQDASSTTRPHAGRRRPARDRDDARRDAPPARAARAPTSTCCSAGGRRSCATGSSTRRFVASARIGFDGAARRARRRRRRRDGARCGLEAAAIVETARGFAEAESAAIFFDLGVEQTPFSTLISYLIRVLLVLTGNVGRPRRRRLPRDAPPAGAATRAGCASRSARSPRASPPSARSATSACSRRRWCPRRSWSTIPSASARVIVEGSNPLLSYSDASRWREAREQLDLLVVIDPAMTETARAGRLRAADAGRLREVGDRDLPEGLPGDLHAGAAAGRARPARGAARAGDLRPARRGDGPLRRRRRPSCTSWRARRARRPTGAMAFLGTAQQAARATRATPRSALLFWTYRTLGPHLPAPSLAAIWLQSPPERDVPHRRACCARSGRTGREERRSRSGPSSSAASSRTPRASRSRASDRRRNLDDHVGFADGRIRLAPEPMLAEIRRALATAPHRDPEFPLVLAAGLRTRWTANTIQRDPRWRKGRGPALRAQPLAGRRARARRARRRRGARRHASRRPHAAGADRREAAWPATSGCRTASACGVRRRPATCIDGANQNELTDVADRDPVHRHPAPPLRALPDRADLAAARSCGHLLAQLRQGSTRIFACRSGLARSRNACATPSTPTRAGHQRRDVDAAVGDGAEACP